MTLEVEQQNYLHKHEVEEQCLTAFISRNPINIYSRHDITYRLCVENAVEHQQTNL